MHAEVKDQQQPSWSRRRVQFTAIVGVLLSLVVVSVTIESSAISELRLFHASTTSSLRTTGTAAAASASSHASDPAAIGSVGAVASSPSSLQGDSRHDSLEGSSQSTHEGYHELHHSSSSSQQGGSSVSPTTAPQSSNQDTQSPSEVGTPGSATLSSHSVHEDEPQPTSTSEATIETTNSTSEFQSPTEHSLPSSAQQGEDGGVDPVASSDRAIDYSQVPLGSGVGATTASSNHDNAPQLALAPQAVHEDAAHPTSASSQADLGDTNSSPTPTVDDNESATTSEAETRPSSVPLLVPGFETPTRDPGLPLAVHALWIGDIDRAPRSLELYHTKGFELTIHNDVDSILDGFSHHVKLAYSLAIPRVVGFDFLKFLMLYKYGGLVVDADTYPNVSPSEVQYSSDCHVLFGKETHLDPGQFSGPTYRRVGSNTYGLTRPYQLLNWAMLAREPRNPHVAALIDGAMRHFFGLRDMEQSLVQDIAGSGLMSDYVGLLYAEKGLSYVDAFNTRTPPMSLQAVDGLCMLENELRDGWIHHDFSDSWRSGEISN